MLELFLLFFVLLCFFSILCLHRDINPVLLLAAGMAAGPLLEVLKSLFCKTVRNSLANYSDVFAVNLKILSGIMWALFATLSESIQHSIITRSNFSTPSFDYYYYYVVFVAASLSNII